MDKKFLNSLFTGEAQNHVIPARRDWERRDLSQDLERNFSSLFDKELDKEDESESTGKKPDQDAANTLVAGGKPTGQEQQEVGKTGTSQVQAEIQQQIKARLANLSPMLNYLYNLMYKNPDALSMLEKKAAGLDKQDVLKEMKKFEVEYQEFKKMLEKRGLKMEDLTLDDIQKLSMHKSKEELETLMDQMAREKRTEVTDRKEEKVSTDKTGREKTTENVAVERSQVMDKPAQEMEFVRTLQNQAPSSSERVEKAQKQRQMVDKIIQQIDVRNLNERTELTMKLNPEFMGDLKLKLSYQDDKISALFETTSKDLRDLIHDSSSDLLEAFREKGLDLSSSKVKLVDSVDEEDNE
jgi:flagellar hook-length control protein FliK